MLSVTYLRCAHPKSRVCTGRGCRARKTETGRTMSERGVSGARVRVRVVHAHVRAADQKTMQPPFQQPAPGNLMALSGVMARKLRRICNSSWDMGGCQMQSGSSELPSPNEKRGQRRGKKEWEDGRKEPVGKGGQPTLLRSRI